MNYLIVLYVVLLFLGALDLLPASKKMHYALWIIAFAFTVFICTIKFYYGPDNTSYVSHYHRIKPLSLLQLDDLRFEVGYIVFASAMKTIGLSFWGLTAVMSVLYFSVLFVLLHKIENYRVFALLIIVTLDDRLFLMQFRECLAVTALMLAYLLYDKRRYVGTVLALVLVVLMHKSGMVFVALFVMAWMLQNIEIKNWMYYGLMGLLLVGALIPPQVVVNLLHTVLSALGGGSVVNSIALHLTRAKQIQTVFLLYMLVLVVLLWQKKQGVKAESNFLEVFVLLCMLVVVLLYPYYFILGRVRSYAIPFVVLLIINRLAQTEHIPLKQLAVAGMTYCMIGFFAVREMQFSQSYPSCAYKYTVFDADCQRKSIAIQGEWSYDTYLFWRYYYQRNKTNQVKVK